jgi:hypothetical protein
MQQQMAMDVLSGSLAMYCPHHYEHHSMMANHLL